MTVASGTIRVSADMVGGAVEQRVSGARSTICCGNILKDLEGDSGADLEGRECTLIVYDKDAMNRHPTPMRLICQRDGQWSLRRRPNQ